MTPEELDNSLSTEERLEPSPSFTRKVMTSVRRHAEDPIPLRFPWWRFAAGVIATSGMAVTATLQVAQLDIASAPAPAAVPVVVYALAMLLVSLGLAAVPHALSKP